MVQVISCTVFCYLATHYSHQKMAFLEEDVLARILVVDDDASISGLVSRVLKISGHQVTLACTIDAAMRVLHELATTPYDLLITDHKIEGSGTCFNLLSRGMDETPFLFPRRVIIMSGAFPGDIEEQVARLRGQGFIPICIQKPIEVGVFASNVATMLALSLPPGLEDIDRD